MERRYNRKTKDVMWKYLQLILFTISGVSNENLLEIQLNYLVINQDEFKNKLEETMENMKNILKTIFRKK